MENKMLNEKNLSLRWCLVVGGFGFLIGFVGPMIFAPDANQGPLLGILITGPIGFLLGGAGWLLSYMFRWTYRTQVALAVACCAVMACTLIKIASEPKPEWPGRIYEIQVTKCSPSSAPNESILETIVLRERQIKKENHGAKPSVYSAGEISYPQPTVVTSSFYAMGSCLDFPVGFTGAYYVANHPSVARDKAVLGALPDFAKGL